MTTPETPAPVPAQDKEAEPTSRTLGQSRLALLKILGLLLAALIAAATGLTAYVWLRTPPVLEYTATTSILEFKVLGRDEAVWNLPAKTVSISRIVDDDFKRTTLGLGLGPLVIPRGVTIRVTRIEGRPLNLSVEEIAEAKGGDVATDCNRPKDSDRAQDCDKKFPHILHGGPNPDGAHNGRVYLNVGDRISIDREAGASTKQSGANVSPGGAAFCEAPLPSMAFRGMGDMTVGSAMQFDAFDTPEDLAEFEAGQYVDLMRQPSLISGHATILGKTLITRGTYRADDFSLQAGDVLRLVFLKDETRFPFSKNGTPSEFIIEVPECGALQTHGLGNSFDLSILRMGGEATPIKLSLWQIITKDTFISFLVGLIGIIVGGLGAYSNLRQIGSTLGSEKDGKSAPTPPQP